MSATFKTYGGKTNIILYFDSKDSGQTACSARVVAVHLCSIEHCVQTIVGPEGIVEMHRLVWLFTIPK